MREFTLSTPIFLKRYSVLYELNTLDACWIVVDVGVKIGGSRVGGPELWTLDRWVTRGVETVFTQVQALSKRENPTSCLIALM